jgi:hypothetical protein
MNSEKSAGRGSLVQIMPPGAPRMFSEVSVACLVYRLAVAVVNYGAGFVAENGLDDVQELSSCRGTVRLYCHTTSSEYILVDDEVLCAAAPAPLMNPNT